jgi:alpha-L-rhamnosidase
MRFAWFIAGVLLMGCAEAAAARGANNPPSLDSRFDIGEVLHTDDFQNGTANWSAELEKGGTVTARGGKLVIDVPAGCTVWFKRQLEGPLLIEYDAMVVRAGGPNDRASDLNCFWMATDARSPTGGLFDVERTGAFADYHALRCYYVGLGGNNNSTTRFRRYVGSPTTRPLLREHDLSEAQFLITPNVKRKIQLVACDGLIQYWYDRKKIFELKDARPYTRGWFAFRTVSNHMTIENFEVRRLHPRHEPIAASDTGRAPTRLTCEYQQDPIGIGETKPRFGWWLSDERRGAKETAYQITVGSAPENSDLWDSGKVESDQSCHIEYAGAPLSARQRCFWRVRTWDINAEPSAWSGTQSFELGLLNPSDWTARWIGSNVAGSHDAGVPAPFLRKVFKLDQPLKHARLYVSALGLYEASINGKRIGDDRLVPGFTDYHKRVVYRTYDVTGHLRPGDNVVGAILGDGWYCGYVGFRGRRQTWGERPLLIVQLEITTADGKTSTIVTDDSWRLAFGPIVSNDLLMGESYNAQLELDGWDSPGFDDSKWSGAVVFEPRVGRIVAAGAPPPRAVKQLKPIDVKPVDARRGKYRLDIGQNVVGHVRLRVRNPPAGRTITLRHAEMLNPDGTLWVAGLRKARATDTFQCRGKDEEVFEPRFTFHGFRYVEIEGYPGELKPDDISAVVVHSDMRQTGEFACSNDLINKLQQNIEWGQRGNFIDVPTDCPQRDERLGWTGDAQVFIRTACFNMDVAGFFTKWLDDLDDAQRDDGAYPSYAPQWEPNDGGPAWADAGVICPWTVYTCFGDKRVLERHYPAMQKYIAFLEKEHPNGLGDERGYGDWLAMDTNTPKPLIGTAFFAHAADLVSRAATVLGKSDDAARYRATFERVRDTFQKEFVTPNGRIVGDSQTAYVLALHFNLLPENLRKAAADRLVADITKRGNHLSTGFVGTPYLTHVLTSMGHTDVAYALLEQKTFPSWLYPVALGATTIWERWDGWTHDKGFQDAGMNSFNHYAYGAIGSWMYQVVAGIDIADEMRGAGYKKLRIRPTPGGGLTWASAKLDTVYGTVRSSWKREGDKTTYDITIPPNTSAQLELQARSIESVFEGGKALSQAEGVSSARVENGKLFCCQIVPGNYQFTVMNKSE